MIATLRVAECETQFYVDHETANIEIKDTYTYNIFPNFQEDIHMQEGDSFILKGEFFI